MSNSFKLCPTHLSENFFMGGFTLLRPPNYVPVKSLPRRTAAMTKKKGSDTKYWKK